jgi:hypothetical protein
MLKFLLTVLLVVPLSVLLGEAQAKPLKNANSGNMTFTLLDVSAICPDCSVIQVSGELGETTLKGYRDLSESGGFKKNTFFIFDSPGGDVKTAMTLGAALRSLKAHTIIGRAVIRRGEIEIEPGRCASSCVFAFIGGITRSMPKESRLGVHSWMPNALIEMEEGQKAKPRLLNQEAVSLLQRQAALHLKFFNLMGIDLRLGILLLQTPFNSIAWVSSSDRSLWGLVTVNSSLSTPGDRRWPVLFLPERTAPGLPRRKAPDFIGDAPIPMGEADTQGNPKRTQL